jgi:hypothetical protein
VRSQAEEERKRTSETLNAVYEEASTEAQALFSQSAERFTAIMQGMKQMAAEMQQELETTRTELRRGVLELPQETAESTAQMRRVIVDQIEALAELNRIVARHGRALDAAEPVRREAEAAYATGGGRAQVRPIRPDINPPPQQQPAGLRDITGAPARRPDRPERAERPEPRPQNPAPGNNGRNNNGGWLSDLLTRASRDDEAPAASLQPSREPARSEERAPRDAVDSLDTLSVDIARMIDHEAAANCGSATGAANAASSRAASTRCKARRRSTKSATNIVRIPSSGRPWSTISTSSNASSTTPRAATAGPPWCATT